MRFNIMLPYILYSTYEQKKHTNDFFGRLNVYFEYISYLEMEWLHICVERVMDYTVMEIESFFKVFSSIDLDAGWKGLLHYHSSFRDCHTSTYFQFFFPLLKGMVWFSMLLKSWCKKYREYKPDKKKTFNQMRESVSLVASYNYYWTKSSAVKVIIVGKHTCDTQITCHAKR